jgi:hypothetical protein
VLCCVVCVIFVVCVYAVQYRYSTVRSLAQRNAGRSVASRGTVGIQYSTSLPVRCNSYSTYPVQYPVGVGTKRAVQSPVAAPRVADLEKKRKCWRGPHSQNPGTVVYGALRNGSRGTSTLYHQYTTVLYRAQHAVRTESIPYSQCGTGR